MKRADEITDELMSMGSNLADLPRTMPYAVPAGYFAGFAGSLQATMQDLDKDEAVPAWGKAMPYATPPGYFSELTGNIIAGARAADIPQQAPFAIPDGYFDGMPDRMLQAAKAADGPAKTKTIPLSSRNIFRQLRWAAAAVLVMGIGVGAYNFYNNSPRTDDPENILASVDGKDIQTYVAGTYRIDPDRIVSSTEINNIQLDNKDIIEYLDETGWD